MAYSSTNPPSAISQRIAGGPVFWVYSSTDTAGTVAASSYFSDGAARGMRVGDILNTTTLSTAGAYAGHANGRISVVTAGAGATATFATSST